MAGISMTVTGTMMLSPCITFRPEQREWKQAVHPAPIAPTDDAGKAARRILTDDGFNIGILYRGDRMVYQPPVGKGKKTPADLERGFEV